MRAIEFDENGPFCESVRGVEISNGSLKVG
jgi:hypothetical protein